jgi:hypothetical protein
VVPDFIRYKGEKVVRKEAGGLDVLIFYVFCVYGDIIGGP